MAKKKTISKPLPVLAPAPTPAASPARRLASPWLAIGLIVVAAVRVASTWPETGLTWDEPGHMACGLQYLAQHVYRYEAQHPPLARIASALGPYLDGVRPHNLNQQDHEGIAEMYGSGHAERELNLMRLGILPFFLLAAAALCLWARRHFGGAVAVISTLLFTLLPPVLAHAGLATTDMPVTGCLIAAFFSLLLWAEEPSWAHSLLLGLMTALAVVTKFTALGYLPAAALLALVAWLIVDRPGWAGVAAAAKPRALPFCGALVTGAVCIWAVYSFSFGKVAGWGISLPAPELFAGIDSALHHNTKGHWAYLLGEVRTTGWWYYFPVVLAVKTPLAFLLLLAGGAWTCWKKRANLVYWLPAAFSLGILLPAMTSNVNIGVRHILPVYAGFSIVAAIAVVQLLDLSTARKWAGYLAAALVVWMTISGALHHPNYIAYFNELAGSHPEKILVDSDLDWGQDSIRLARRLKELGAKQVNFTTLNQTPDRLEVWPGFPPTKLINPFAPAEGWTAVGPTMWFVRQYGMEHRYPNLQPWFAYLQPVEQVSSYYLYYVPPGSIPPSAKPQ